MHTLLLVGLLTFPFLLLCNGEISNPGFCSNPWSAAHTLSLETCFFQKTNSIEKVISNLPLAINFTESANPPIHPWTRHPFCNSGVTPDTTFCVYTIDSFASGRGISFIGTPQSVQLISRNRIFHSPSEPKANDPPYEVRQLPDRGYGLLANKTMHVGHEIMAHTPVIAVQVVIEEVISREELWKLFRVGIDRLPQRTRDLFNALQGDAGGDEVYDRFSTNAFELYDYGAVFPETAVSAEPTC
jgi:hypothetical protein